MNIRITQLKLENFKCFRSKELTFDSDATTIQGRNGVGKTTIADAILWCLFGKNSAGQADFSVKTNDDSGHTIPHLDHSVQLTLSVSAEETAPAGSPDGKTIILRRTLREQWVKRRGTDEQVLKNNTTEYLVNGEVLTATDYKKYVSALVTEDIFRAITNPNHFPSLMWQEQREFLPALADMSDFRPTKEEAAILPPDQSFEQYRKHLAYQIRQVKEKLDRIPVRLEEQNKALPKALDWPAIESQRADVLRRLQEVDGKILAIRTGNAADVQREELRKELKNLRDKAEEIEEAHRATLRSALSQRESELSEASRRFNTLLNTQRDLEASIKSFDALKARGQETLDQCERDAQQIREQWAANLSRRLEHTEVDCVCPTCGQYLPPEQVAEKRQRAEADLNQQKADRKADLTAQAEKVKKLRADAEELIKDYDRRRTEAEQTLADTKEQINKAFSDKAAIERRPVPTLEGLLKDDDVYQLLLEQIQTLQSDIVNVKDDGTAQRLFELNEQAEALRSELSQCEQQIATKSQYDRIQSLINDINDEQRKLIEQLSNLERQDDVITGMQQRHNTILEERINRYFSVVQWRLFRTVNNGGDAFEEPYCECYVGGAAYHDGLNQAARLNAGLDIINTLCRHYNVTAPIVIDNAESNLNILKTASQQIRLQVADTPLQIF